MIRTHTFNGVTYDIDICGSIDGYCECPWPGKPILQIVADLDTRRGLETAIHEAMHACNYMKSEESVGIAARDIARFLWRLNYRRR